ncbi:uncharacterized protein LOC117651742 [Thrips palmi]|uniref:NADH dehydrogenase [ubiquinone] 1 beta subcomplex subunit 11, mitochondrial n=1 Tax=Thrips palmi TaxID=161013 RepID=A0A6P9A2B8_THRPL|nr:uncharacterized protein LOC117651742 [Thrips palmi]
MASLSRLHNICSLTRILSNSGRFSTVTARRWISKSEGKQDSAPAKHGSSAASGSTVPKIWVSYGFSQTNYYEDRLLTHLFMFLGISWAIMGSCWIIYYYPDMNKHEWYRREAFLELRRREAAGLPLVDPNYVPPSQIKLPSDEELGPYEIII